MNDTRNKIVELNLNDILPNRFQPRIQFNEEAIIGLSDSIREHGVLEPIIVRPIGDKYEIVAGERRYKACVLANLETIPARIVDMNDHDSVEIALIENVQRRDLTPIEEALSYNRILDVGYLTQEQLAQKLGKSQSTIANKKRLLNLCDEVQEALIEEKISERHARSLLKLSSASAQKKMLNRIITERLTVRRLDEEIDKELANMTDEEQLEEVANTLLNVENDVGQDSIIDISGLFDDDITPINKKEPASYVENAPVSSPETNGSSQSQESLQPALDSLIKPNNYQTENTVDSQVLNTPNVNVTSQQSIQTEVPTPSFDMPSPELMPTMPNAYETPVVAPIEPIMQPVSNESIPVETPTMDSYQETPSYDYNSLAPTETTVPSFENNSTDTVETSEPLLSSGLDVNNSVDTNTQPIINSTRFSKFFDPEYFADDPEYQQEPLIAPTMDIDNLATVATNNESTDMTPLDTSTPSTLFPDLMNGDSNNETNNDIINQEDLNDFLDPSIIDGQKQETPENIGIIDASVFAKFLDPDYDINNIDSEIKEKEEVKPMSFAQYLNNDNNSQPQVTPAPNPMAPVQPMTPAPDMLAPQGVEAPQPMPDILAPQSAQPEVPSTGFDMPKPDLMATMPSSYDVAPMAPVQPMTPAPDMLAPQGVETPQPMPDILAPQSVQPEASSTGFDMPKPDLMATMPSSYDVAPMAPVQPMTPAPDMLAPQGVETPQPMPDILAPQSTIAPMPMQDMGAGGQSLTPDVSFGLQPEPVQPQETPLTENYQIPEESEPQGFVMATNDQQSYNMPATPILDTNTNTLFQPPVEPVTQPQLEEQVSPLQPLVEPEITSAPSDEELMSSQMENQPIIITDYNKQYDPLLPDSLTVKEPKVDLRQVIDMIRNLSDQIEDLGFKIDTDEVDLDDSYQVTFTIEKKN